jgi:hypothetical protein
MTPDEVYNYYSSKLNHKNTPPVCEYCGKEYATKDTAFRVHRSRCKKEFEKTMRSEFSIPEGDSITIEEKYKLSQEENAKLKEQIEALKNSNITYNDNSVHNNIVVVVNSFGNEDLSHLDTPDFKKRLENVMKHHMLCWDALPFFIQRVHYGNPKNENIMIENDSIRLYNGKTWKVQEKKQVFTQLVNDNWVKMQDYLDDSVVEKKTFQMVQEKVHDSPTYKTYVHGQINTVIANKGDVNVFNPTGDQGSKQIIMNEFILE